MGLILVPVYREEVRTPNPQTTGEFLAAEFRALDEIASLYGLTPISAFSDQRDVPDDFDGPPWDLEEILGPCEDWFAAADGSRALSALAEFLRDQPDVAERIEGHEWVIEELEDLSRQLGFAAESGAHFRLELR